MAGVLLVSIALIFTAREDRGGFPSVTNTKASGYAAMAELLRRDGYTVRLERDVKPSFKHGEVVIALTRGTVGNEEFDEFMGVEEPSLDLHRDRIQKFMDAGGRVIEIVNAQSFEIDSARALEAQTEIASAFDPDLKYKLSLPYGTPGMSEIEPTTFPYGAWTVSGQPFVGYKTVGDGMLVVVGDGVPFTNRLLDRAQNAEFLLKVVRAVAPSGGTLVFDESMIGNAEAPTVANTLGKWAVAARWQAGILFVVLIYTLSRRFGLPETERRSVRSSRELFDAISDVFRRTGNTGLALDNLLVECDQRIRRVLNAPNSAKRSDILQMAPVALREQYLHVSEHANANSSPRKAADAARKLLDTLVAFENDSRAVRGLKR
jgi:hypothetical protein